MRRVSHSLHYRLTRWLAGSRLVRLVPAGVRHAVRLLIDVPVIAALVDDRRSFRRLARVWVHEPTDEPVAVRIKGLGADPVFVRPGTADIAVARDLGVSKPHLTGEDWGGPKEQIWDLGAHIGLAARQYAVLNPGARVMAVEFNADNADLCRRNLAPYSDRCEVVQAAVWATDGHVPVHDGGDTDTNGYSVAEVEPGGAGGDAMVIAMSLNTLAEKAAGAMIDFCKMDIEGAERGVLRENVEWAENVQTISVEVHGSYSEQECADDLRRLGFHPGAGDVDSQVIGTRRSGT